MHHLQLHPMMVHFPLALTITGTFCLLCARLIRPGDPRDSLAAAGTWNFMFGGITVLITLGSGVIAVSQLHLHDAAQHSVSRHVLWAVCTSQLIVALGLWRAVGKRTARPSWFFLGLALIACAGLIGTGYWGGENVYHYGLGVTR